MHRRYRLIADANRDRDTDIDGYSVSEPNANADSCP